MLLHPKIFNGNACEASENLGIARSTLLGWVSMNVKSNVVSREQLMTWVENVVNDFNCKEAKGLTNIISPCLSKFGQDCFEHDKTTFRLGLALLIRMLCTSHYWRPIPNTAVKL